MQISLTGFLERNTKPFVTELWKQLHSATENPAGIPTAMLERKQAELAAKRVRCHFLTFSPFFSSKSVQVEDQRMAEQIQKKKEQVLCYVHSFTQSSLFSSADL